MMLYCPSIMSFSSIAAYWVFLYTRSAAAGMHVWQENLYGVSES